MRIAQVTPVYPPYRGGMARVAFEYTKRLRARGHDVHTFTPRYGDAGDVDLQDAGHVHRIPATFRVGNAATLPSLSSDLAGFDIVHLHYPFYGGAEPVVRARSSGRIRGLVLTYHMDATASGLKGTVFDVHRETVQPWIVSQADALLVSSRDYAAASALAHIEGALERVDVCPFGVDLDRFHPGEEPDLRASLAIGAEVPVVLFVGSLDAAHRFKGLDVLVTALTRLLHLSWHLVVVGDGDDRARFEREAAEHGLSARTVFVGDVTDDLLPRHYRLADVHVLPSTSRAEAFGLVTLEAAASAVPSIVPDLCGVRTNVVHGMTGLIVPAGDASALGGALRDLLSSAERREHLGRDARLRVERECQWAPLIDRLEAVYQTVARVR
jgi:glycosyltransferase involved in cell wall biosynthesis